LSSIPPSFTSECVDQLVTVDVQPHAFGSIHSMFSSNDTRDQRRHDLAQSRAADGIEAERENTHETSESADHMGPQQRKILLRSVEESLGWATVILAVVAIGAAFVAAFFVSSSMSDPQTGFLRNYLSQTWSGFDAEVLEIAEFNPCESLHADLNTNVMIVVLLLGITVNMSLSLPSPCDGVNILGTCAANDIALEVQRTADVVCSLLCIISMLIGAQLIIDLGRVPPAQAKNFIVEALPALGAKNVAFEFAVWAFTLSMIIHILVVLRPPQAIGCFALLVVGTAGTIAAKKASLEASQRAIVAAESAMKSPPPSPLLPGPPPLPAAAAPPPPPSPPPPIAPPPRSSSSSSSSDVKA